MGLIADSKIDAFISYAHDDEAVSGNCVSYIYSTLKKMFEVEMRRRIPNWNRSSADIFMDKHGLPSNGDLTYELETKVHQSHFLIIIVGHSYID